MQEYNMVVIGAGPAGMAAALEAEKNGLTDIVILERDEYIGGILPQCIHNGFGLEYFGEELTGPEYAYEFIDELADSNIEVLTETMVLDVDENKEVTALNKEKGVLKLKGKTIVLAMGCRERTRENIRIPGDRPSGILSAGTAQRYTNIEGYMPGEKVVILGSGDIGLIMARRMRLEGADVKAVLEIMPFSSGLVRNKVQCLDDFDIPLKLQHTITRIEGQERLERVRVAQVDEDFNPIEGTQEWIECDTLLLSVGLIPENELSKAMGLDLHPVTGGTFVNENRETSIEGVYAAGNVLHVHDLVDWVSEEAEIAGKAAADYINNNLEKRAQKIEITPAENVTYTVPQTIEYTFGDKKFIKVFMRVTEPMEDVEVKFSANKEEIISYPKKIVMPGEMVTANLPAALVTDEMEEIKVSIVKKAGENNG
ncbi:MAG TPA: FAD-dependent oxidoreductase [Halanaerobiales bacterium]|nr:FAD-dependent oxidoreductase [Halanaerobiales bacterium]